MYREYFGIKRKKFGYVGATINADCEGAINTIGVSLGFTNISTIMEGIHTIIELTINRSIEKE